MEFTTHLGLHSQTARLADCALVEQHGPDSTGLSPSLTSLSRELGSGALQRMHLQTTIRGAWRPDFQAGLFPVRSPLLGKSWLVSSPPLSDMLKLSGWSFLIRGPVRDVMFCRWRFSRRGSEKTGFGGTCFWKSPGRLGAHRTFELDPSPGTWTIT